MKDDEIPQTGDSTGGSSRACLQDQTNPPRRILVVEDDISILQLITDVLNRSGYHVDTAADGAAGWEALQAKHYDLLITDNSMPKVTGVELVRMLRGQDAILPVIMASGAIPTEQLKRHPLLGINAILLKPYTFAELVGTVKEVLRATDSARSPREILLAAGSSASAPPISQGE